MQRGRRFSGSGVKKRTVWDQVNLGFTMLATANQIRTEIAPEPLLTDNRGTAKLLRSIGGVSVLANGTDLGTLQATNFGITVLTRDAMDAGITPDPTSDRDQSWYYWTKVAPAGNAPAGGPPITREWDIHTQRVLRSGWTMAIIFDKLATELALDVEFWVRNLWEIW